MKAKTILAAAASLLLAPCLFAQTPAAPAPDSAAKQSPQDTQKPKEKSPVDNLPLLYTLKFEGGEVRDLNDVLRKQLSAENVVIAGESLMRMKLPPFELRNVKLAEVARTIEFLGEGNLHVEVVENAGSGDLWRIGRKNTAEAGATVKMRSVAAPHLFADEKALADIEAVANDVEMKRLQIAGVLGGVRGVFRGAVASPLKSQKIFVITGDEEGVTGLESVIKAAEQRLGDAAAANAASLAANAPKMRAVLAPHVFGVPERRDGLLKTADKMRMQWARLHSQLLEKSGSKGGSAFEFGLPWMNVEVDQNQSVFMLFGTDAAIAGMESLIRAAEQRAAEEDAETVAEVRAAEAKEEARGREEAALKAAKQPAKVEKRDQ